MELAGRDVSYNPNEDDKVYDRTVYHCVADDIWITTEVPKTDSNK